MALTKVTGKMSILPSFNVKAYGAVGDGIADDTAAIQAAINAADKDHVFFPNGIYRVTDTLQLGGYTKLVGENGAGGTFAAYSSIINFDVTLTKTTLSANINNSVTTIPLANASAFPTSGIVYLVNPDGEYIKYTGKSGNSLTGCTRGYYGGTVGATAYSSGDAVILLQPCLMRDPNSFSGTIKDMRINNANFVDNATGWDDLGVACYFSYAAYATVLDNSLINGFEKACYVGQAYVTQFTHPMVYRCNTGIQCDGWNGGTAYEVDFGSTGSGSLPDAGWCFYIRGGNGAAINGGNLSNGSYNVPVYVRNSDGVTLKNFYIEAAKLALVDVRENSSVFIDGAYLKECQNFGDLATDSQLHISNVSHTLTTFERVINNDDTGSWSVTNIKDIANDEMQDDMYGIGTLWYRKPNASQATSPNQYQPIKFEKAVANNTATGLFKVTTLANASNPNLYVGLRVNYMFKGGYSSGFASEKGTLEIMIQHRQTLAPVVNVVEVGTSQATYGGVTLATTFSGSTAAAGSAYDTTISLTAVSSNSAAGELVAVIEPLGLITRGDASNLGNITLL